MSFSASFKSRLKRGVAFLLERGDRCRAWRGRCVLSGLGVVENYQPFAGGESGSAGRGSSDRWAAIEPRLGNVPGSCLDVGCNAGYFSFKMAERGHFCVGIEGDRVYWELAEAGRLSRDLRNVFFLNGMLAPENVGLLPRFGTVFCLSVFHHWVKGRGFGTADRMMRELSRKCDGQMVFETGQADEAGTKWAKELAFMGKDPEAWIGAYLKDLGFKKVERAGSFPTTVSPTPRHLFVASKKEA